MTASTSLAIEGLVDGYWSIDLEILHTTATSKPRGTADYGEFWEEGSVVAEQDGRIVGAPQATPCDRTPHGPFIIELFVDFDLRGRGIARSLVEPRRWKAGLLRQLRSVPRFIRALGMRNMAEYGRRGSDGVSSVQSQEVDHERMVRGSRDPRA
jgi:GNAT superfamily N-acetyltransferase